MLFCDKGFTARSNRNRHLNYCDKKPTQLQMIIDEVMRAISERLSTQPVQQNTNNITNNVTNNVQINISGKESIDHVSEETLTDYLLNNKVVDLLRDINFNPDKPKNHNVKRITYNKNWYANKYMKVFEENGWRYGKTDAILAQKICQCINVLSKHKQRLVESNDILPRHRHFGVEHQQQESNEECICTDIR